ncbi:MAG: hypothetical protein BWZ00_01600 [Bacteroidetes bacterium ADurb.BinA174]|nr:MAG: hypothetical protein BWZ00_01600 [Bacteroidetes bacterium ADurb.BinA174]
MQFTNNFKMPDVFYRLIQREREAYVTKAPKGVKSYGVTTLIDSPFIYKLRRKHDSEITEDVVDSLFAFRGKGLHEGLASVPIYNVIPKINIGMMIGGSFGDVWVGGELDVLRPYTIEDYKMKMVEAVWFFNDNSKLDLTRQLNLYKLLAECVFGWPIHNLIGQWFLINWVSYKAKIDKNYPQKPHVEIPVDVWSRDDAWEYLYSRVTLFEKPLEETPICDPVQRWQKKTQWAVTKKGNKKALKCEDSEAEIKAYIAKKELKEENYEITKRQGEDTRCIRYCNVNKFCPYYQQTYAGKEIEQEEPATE